MTTRHTFPQPGDTNDAAKFAQHLGRDNITDYVATGMDFTVDYTVPEVTVSDGKAYAMEKAAHATLANEDLNYGFDYVFEFTQQTTGLVDNAVNYVWLDGNIGTDDSPQVTANTTGSEPSDVSLLLGLVDTSDNTYTIGNRDPDASFTGLSQAQDLSGGETYVVPSGYRMEAGNEYEINGTLELEQGAVFETEQHPTEVSHYSTVRADQGLMHKNIVPEGQTVTIPEGYDMIVTENFSVEGTLNVDGTLKFVPERTDVEEFQTIRANHGLMYKNRVPDGQSFEVPEGYTMLVAEGYDIDGDVDVDGELVSIPTEFGITINNIDDTVIIADGGSSTGFDGSFTTNITDETEKFDVVVSVESSTPYTYSYNTSKGYKWNGSEWVIELTVNWNEMPGAGNDVAFSVEVQSR